MVAHEGRVVVYKTRKIGFVSSQASEIVLLQCSEEEALFFKFVTFGMNDKQEIVLYLNVLFVHWLYDLQLYHLIFASIIITSQTF